MAYRLFRDLVDPRDIAILNYVLRDLDRRLSYVSFLGPLGTIPNAAKPVNLSASWVRYVSNAVANTDDTVTHSLGRLPLGFFTSAPSNAGVIYRGSGAWTSTTVSLRSSLASTTVDLLVF